MFWAIINPMLSSLHIEFPKDLPVSTKRDQAMAALAAHQVTIVSGKTGSGKTTQLPKIALAMGRGLCNYLPRWPMAGPRRDALRPAGWPSGLPRSGRRRRARRWVSRCGSRTHCCAYATIIIDEAHERSGAFRGRMSHIFVNTTHILSRIIYNSAHAHLQPA